MFFYLSKLLAFLISPLVWVFVLLIYSLVTKNKVRSRKALIAGLSLLYLSGNSFLVDECYRQWELTTPDYVMQKNQYAGAIVLGGIGEVDLRVKKINFGYSADRLFQVLPLYYQGFIQRIIFTGGSGSIEFPEKKEGIYVRKYLRSIQIPDSILITESESKNTYENAIFTKKVLDSLHMNGNYLLVTSSFHMRRSLAIFKKAGYSNITPFITNKLSGKRRFTLDHLFIPNPGAMLSLQALIHEWTGYLIYTIRGYA